MPVQLQEAAQAGAKLVILPEMWNCPYSNDCFPKYAEDIDAGRSASVSEMSASAKESGVTLVAGSIPESSNGKVYNTCCIFDDQGKLLAKHRKVSPSTGSVLVHSQRSMFSCISQSCITVEWLQWPTHQHHTELVVG